MGQASSGGRSVRNGGPAGPGDQGELHAVAVLKPASGAERPHTTTANIRDRHADPATVASAARLITELGFTVSGSSPLGVSFRGPAVLFERTFGSSTEPLVVPEGLKEHVERVTLSKGVRYWDRS